MQLAQAAQAQGRCSPSRSGFSYAEILIVILMVAVLWSVAMPRYASSTHRTRVEAASLEIVAAVNLARRLARTQGRSCQIAFDVPQQTYELIGVKHPHTPSADYRIALDEGFYPVELRSARFASGENSQTTLTFNIYGRPIVGSQPLSTGSIVVRSGEHQREVSIDAVTGRATVL